MQHGGLVGDGAFEMESVGPLGEVLGEHPECSDKTCLWVTRVVLGVTS